jgi:tripartite-type tricarboxylate transporter receptor subunit TctC
MKTRPLLYMLATVILMPAIAQAQTANEFFKGRKMTLITSASVGGGYDQYARLLSRHMPKHIQGSPSMIVQNMPGAEGIKAGNYLYTVAPRDGSVIGGLQRNTGLAKFYAPDSTNAQFDVRKFTWLGSTQQEIGFFMLRTNSGVSDLEGLRKNEVTVSSSSRNSPSSIYPRLLNALYGTKLRVIEGYDGSQAALLAVERGEVDGHISGGTSAAFRARYRPWEKSGQVAIILQLGMERDHEYPNVATALDLAPDPMARAIFEIAFVEQVMGRPFVIPPEVPKDRIAVLRDAFDKTMIDKEFLEDAAKQGVEIDPVSGAHINELLDKVYTAPPDLARRVRELVQ